MSEVKQIDYRLLSDHLEAWCVREVWESEDGFTDTPQMTTTCEGTLAFTDQNVDRLFAFIHQWGEALLQTYQPAKVTFQVCMEGLITLKQVYAIERICGALCVSANEQGLHFFDLMPVMDVSFTLWNDQAMLAQGIVPPHLAIRN